MKANFDLFFNPPPSLLSVFTSVAKGGALSLAFFLFPHIGNMEAPLSGSTAILTVFCLIARFAHAKKIASYGALCR
jgi:hypothetical protein